MKSAAGAAPGCMLGGKTVAGFPGICLAASQIIQDMVYDFYNAEPANARFFASNNMAVPAELFRSLGGFDEAFRVGAEDRDRANAGGRRRLVYVPEAVVSHCRRLTFAGFLRQHFRYGRAAARFHRRRMRLASSRFRDHLGLHRDWRAWLFRPWREASGSRAIRLQLLLLVWQITNAAGFVHGWLFDGRPDAEVARAARKWT